MIRILDSNTLIYLQARALVPRAEHACFVPDAIKDEFVGDEQSEEWSNKCAFLSRRFDEGGYLAAYGRYVNSYNDLSFYNMKGFGDVAILAIFDLALAEIHDGTRSLDLFADDRIFLVTNDRELTKFVKKNLPEVHVEKAEDFAKAV